MSRAIVTQLAEQAGVEPADALEYWEERAAIREIDGGQDREAAERDATEDIRELLEIGTWALQRKGPRSTSSLASNRRGRETG